MYFWQVRHQYEVRLQKAIWPTIPNWVVPQISREPSSAPVVLFLGDSRMAYWGLPSLNHWTLVNAGGPGSTSGQCLLGAAQLMEQYQPKAVVIETGINDLKYLGLEPGLKDALVRLVTSNISNIASLCAAKGSRVIVLEIWPASTVDFRHRLIWNKAVDDAVLLCNQALRRLNSGDHQVRVLDLLEAAGVHPSPETYADTLHLKRETYRKLEPVLEKALNESSPATGAPVTKE